MNLRSVLRLLIAGGAGSIAFGGTLLRQSFESADWPARTVSTSGASVTASCAYGAYGTIDTQTDVANNGVDVYSKGLLFTVDSSAAGSNAWSAGLKSGVLSLTTTNPTVTNLGLVTLSFSLRASTAHPVVVRLESYDSAGTTRTGGLSRLIYPATANYTQRFALDLSTFSPDGAGTFDPTAQKIIVTFELNSAAGGDGWPSASGLTLRIDNVNYATPRWYVAPTPTGSDTTGDGSAAKPYASANKALGQAQPGDIIVMRAGTYVGSASFKNTAGTLPLAGAPDAWIVLKNYPGETPVLRYATWNTVSIAMGSSTSPYTGPTCAYLEVRGLDILGYNTVDPVTGDRGLDSSVASPSLQAKLGPTFGETNANGITVDCRYMSQIGHDIRIADNIVEYNSGGGISVATADRIQIENNISRYNCWWMSFAGSGISSVVPADFANNSDYRSLVQGNQSYGNETMAPWTNASTFSDGNGIIIDINRNADVGANAFPAYRGHTLVQNNLSCNNGGSGIHAFNAQNVDIIHNTAYLNSASPRLRYGQIYAGYAKNVRVIGNILVAPDNPSGDSSLNEAYTSNSSYNVSGTIYYQNNLFFGLGNNLTVPSGQSLTPSANFTPNPVADPQFLAPSLNPAFPGNFELRSASPARNAAPVIPYRSALDVTGRPRLLSLSTADLGAYQTQVANTFAPACSPAPGNYTTAQSVALSCDTSGAKIVYTTDGTTPTVNASGTPTNGSVYTGAIPLSVNTTLEAVAWKSGLATSDVSGGTYTFNNLSAVPIPDLLFITDAGSYASAQLVGIVCRTPGALVRYTTDGSIPSSTYGTLAGAPLINIAGSTILRAIAYLPGRASSAVHSGTYIINGVPINDAPFVSIASAPATLALSATAILAGAASDDGLPNPPGTLSFQWTKTSGPGTATFDFATKQTTTATFSATGTYVLRLTVSDGSLSGYAETTVNVVADGTGNTPQVVYRETFGNAVGAATPAVRFNDASIGWRHYTAPDDATNVTDASGTNGGADYHAGRPSNLPNVNAGGTSASQVNGYANSLNASRALVFTTEYTLDRSLYTPTTLSWYSHISATNGGANNQTPAVRIAGQWYVITLPTAPAGNLSTVGGGGNFNTSATLLVLNFASATAANSSGVVTSGWHKLAAAPGSPFVIDPAVVSLPAGNIDGLGVYFTTAGASTTRFDSFELQATHLAAPPTLGLVSTLNPATLGASVTFTATASGAAGTPTGTVQFTADSLALGTATLNGSGVATLTTSALSVGLDTVTATYSGDANYSAGPPVPLTQTVNLADGTTRVLAINAAGDALPGTGFDADYAFAGGATTTNTNAIDLTAAANPAPQAVYQSERYGPNLVYTLTGLTPSAACRVRLHFSEAWWGTVPARIPGNGKRLIDIAINGTVRASAFDVFTAGGAPYKAVVLDYLAITDASGQLVVTLSGNAASTDLNAFINGLELYTVTKSDAWRTANFTAGQLANAAVSGLTADPDGDGMVNLLEYALGTNPVSSASNAVPVAALDGGGHLTLTFNRIADPALTYAVYGTSDLTTWSVTPLWTSTGAQNTAGPVTVTDSLPAAPRRFLRLKVILP